VTSSTRHQPPRILAACYGGQLLEIMFANNTDSNPAGRNSDLTAVTWLRRQGSLRLVNHFSLSPRPCTAIVRLTVKKQIVINNGYRGRTAFRANSAGRWRRSAVELSPALTPQQANEGIRHTGDFVRKDTQMREPSVSRIYLRPEVLGKEHHG